MALKLGELTAVLKTDNRPLEAGLEEGKRQVRAAGRSMEGDATTTAAGIARSWGRGGRDAGDSFVRDAGGRLRDGRGRFTAAGSDLGDAAAQGIRGGMRTATGAVVDFASQLGTAMGPITTVAAAVLGIGTAASFAAPLVGVLAGALGSLPGLIGGLGILTGVLGLGMMGLGDAFKKTAGGGGAVVDRAYQIAQAERRLRDANEEVTASQENLTRARVKATEAAEDLARAEQRAAENLQDLSRNLAGARLDEEDATLRVQEAQERYNETLRTSGDPLAVQRADLALRQAKQSAEDATDRVQDLGQEQADAAQKGIEGSDEVKAAEERYQAAVDQVTEAKKRERAAVEGVADAEHSLQQARKSGGGGGAAAEITKLAPAAAAAVAAIKSLKPAFESLRLDVQERLFAGVGDRIKEVAAAWLPTLRARLGSMATTVNGLFHQLAGSVSKPEFISGMSAGMESFEGLVKRVGGSLAGPFVDAWGRLAGKAMPFIKVLGEEFGGFIDDFSGWIKSADKSGKLESFFEKAAGYLHQIFSIGKTVVGIVGQIIGAIWGSAGKTDPLKSFQSGLESVKAWLANPENIQKVQGFFTSMIHYTQEFIAFLKKLGPYVGPTFAVITALVDISTGSVQSLTDSVGKFTDALAWVGKNAPKWWGAVKNAAGAAKDWIVTKYDQLISFVGGLPKRIGKAAGGMWDGVKNSFRSMINWLIGRWNNLSFTIGGGSFAGISLPSATFNTPNIPYLAQGGIVPATPGGRLIGAGDGGEDEAVIPLSKLAGMIGGGGLRRIAIDLSVNGDKIRSLIFDGAIERGQTPAQYLKVA